MPFHHAAQEIAHREKFVSVVEAFARVVAEYAWEMRGRSTAVGNVKELTDVFNRDEAAEEFGVSVATIRKWEIEGILHRIGGMGPRTVRYSRVEIEAVKRGRVTGRRKK
jgi:hypothetical protein